MTLGGLSPSMQAWWDESVTPRLSTLDELDAFVSNDFAK